MNKSIEHYVFHKENFLDEKFCENSINVLNKNDWKTHTWYFPRTDSVNVKSRDEPDVIGGTTFSNSEALTVGSTYELHGINEFIIDNLHSAILEYVKSLKFKWFDEWQGYNVVKFIRYRPGQIMQNHCDHIHSMFDGERKGIPILSIIGILNDDYEGGELIMFEDKKIDTKKGDLLVFPSNFLYPHKVAPVTKGVRYSYVSWVW